MNEYRMSSAGSCPRSLAAERLGYEPIKEPASLTTIGRESTRHESWVADDLTESGIILYDEKQCKKCSDERHGIHVELETPIIKLVGHMDRRIIIGDKQFPLEIKALGRFTFDQFDRGEFSNFSGYEAQEICYLEAEGKPGYYVVKSRDTGKLLKYFVPYKGHYPPELPGFTRELKLSMDIDSILERIHWAEICVQDNILPDYKCNEKESRYCNFRYLCSDVKEEEVAKEVNFPDLVEAAELYKEGKIFSDMAEERIEQAKAAFLNYAKTVDAKFRVGGVSVSYAGQKQKSYVDEKKLRELVDKELLDKIYAKGKPYDSVYIRVLKEE